MSAQNLIIVKEYIPSMFDKAKPIAVGYTAKVKDRDTYTVYDKEGKEIGTYKNEIIKKISKSSNSEGKTLAQDIGAQIQRAREFRGMTLEQLAAKRRATRQYLHGIEKGTFSCSLEQLNNICDDLGYQLNVKITRKNGSK